METVFYIALLIWVAVLTCDGKPYKPSCRKVEARDRVRCGYPGISKKDCLNDCHCCYDDDVYKSNIQCFFRDAPPAVELCCDVKRRVPCRLKNKNLDEDPYTCRQLGCCYDAGDGQKPDRRPGKPGRRPGKPGRRPRKPGYGGRRRRPGKYRRPVYGYGYGNGYGGGYGHYGDGDGYGYWPPQDPPRCFKTSRKCCRRITEHVPVSDRKVASYGSVSRRQCLRNRNACWDGGDKPQCFYKFPPCRCPVKSLKCKPCDNDYNQHRLDKSHSKCIAAGCCYRAASSQNNCIKPRKRRRGRNAADEDDGMADPDNYNYEDFDDENDDDDEMVDNDDHDLINDIVESVDVDEPPGDQKSDANEKIIQTGNKDDEMAEENVVRPAIHDKGDGFQGEAEIGSAKDAG